MKRAGLACALLLLAGAASAQEATYEKDAQGRIAAVTTAGGTTRYTHFEDGLIETVEYPGGAKDTFRREDLVPASADPVASKNRFAFTGYMWEPEVGLYYAKARYYDPEVGRQALEGQVDLVLTDFPLECRALWRSMARAQ